MMYFLPLYNPYRPVIMTAMINDLTDSPVFFAASLTGSVAFALSGYLLGRRKQLDLMGVFILAFLTANGGGVIRDLLVSRPPAAMQSTLPFWICLSVVAIAWISKLHTFHIMERRRGFVVCDAIGLCAFAISGALIALDENSHFFGVLTLALLTAVGGGIIRDLLVNEVPEVLAQRGGFYGSVALLIGAVVYALFVTGWLNVITLSAVFGAGLLLRLVAWHRQWKLPGN
jgi:uncharacterized membrane protein YeiH